ncbi:5-(carboxyamino)imidazole ribonucleotide synthase [Corynebacterium sp. HMSC074A09]|uniref:5-(carboxyamino)imidazole ribonucleotide synthase n=1 Tax=Corynebacterium sp. HMSC074A09 TaxID=1739311 RepID=UPI0008A4C705|nr:5-(carboxyamino)imidazole ribonucleotide synthase [Corynebacterium sp. HMSC074A09]OFK70218.1 5-(carboxyamino)imidazole ribonucleotide synthase [Corynebacterium sp. HMSC074A09]
MPDDHGPKASIERVSEQHKPLVTVYGDGQLARMMQPAAAELDIHLRVLASAPDKSAAQVIPDVVLGDYHDLDVLTAAAEGANAITFEHEHVPTEHVQALIADGLNVQPQPSALLYAQDKLLMRQKLAELGAPVPRFAAIESVEDARDFAALVDDHVCLKARRGGYDGHGVWFPSSEELEPLVEELLAAGTPLMAEEKVALTRELSVLVARRPSGEVKVWPVTESVQRDGICAEAFAPAPNLSPELAERAMKVGIKVATELGVTGVLAVELFAFATKQDAGCIIASASGAPGAVVEEDIAVNELAMRPHNTGHWTQDGCVTSQFEQHLRAVLDLPLGSTAALAPVTVMTNVLGAEEDPQMPMPQRVREVMERYPEAKVHLYGKDHQPGRKIGHVNVVGEDVEETRRIAHDAAHFLVHAQWA